MPKCNSGAIILLYHGVTSSPSFGIENFSAKHLPVKEFDLQMGFLKQNTTILTLRTLLEHLKREVPLAPNSVAITFDDSYKNIHDVVLPILKRYRIPATFFISTGFVGTKKMFWVDQVEHMINMSCRESIELSLNSGLKRFSLRTPSEKISTIIEIKAAAKQMSPHERNRTLISLQDCTGVKDNGDAVANYTNLTWDDVCELDEPPFYEVGGHTVNHEIMSYLSEKQLRCEVRECKKTIEIHLGHTIDLFSYPEGQLDHFNESVILELKQAGITICPSAVPGINRQGTDSFYLRRNMVGFMGNEFPFNDFSGN